MKRALYYLRLMRFRPFRWGRVFQQVESERIGARKLRLMTWG
jgi:hypothetical protein